MQTCVYRVHLVRARVCVREKEGERLYRLGEIRTPRPSSSQRIDYWVVSPTIRSERCSALKQNFGPRVPSNIQLVKSPRLMSTRRVRRVSEESEVAALHEQPLLGGRPGAGTLFRGRELRTSGVTSVKCRVGGVGSVLRSELRLKRVRGSAVKMARVAGKAAPQTFTVKPLSATRPPPLLF